METEQAAAGLHPSSSADPGPAHLGPSAGRGGKETEPKLKCGEKIRQLSVQETASELK